MKRETLFLKVVVILIGLPVLALCLFGLPLIAKEAAEYFAMHWVYPAFIGLYGAAMSYFFALYQAFKLLSYIDKNIAFSELSVRSLKTIKHCAIAISILFSASLPLFYLVADADDAPGLMLIGLVINSAPVVIAVFAAVLQKLLKNAIELKLENDLTV